MERSCVAARSASLQEQSSSRGLRKGWREAVATAGEGSKQEKNKVPKVGPGLVCSTTSRGPSGTRIEKTREWRTVGRTAEMYLGMDGVWPGVHCIWVRWSVWNRSLR